MYCMLSWNNHYAWFRNLSAIIEAYDVSVFLTQERLLPVCAHALSNREPHLFYKHQITTSRYKLLDKYRTTKQLTVSGVDSWFVCVMASRVDQVRN